MLTGSVSASKSMAKMSTLKAVAPIPAFVASSMPWLRRCVVIISMAVSREPYRLSMTQN
jgi:hypothetical protein